MLDPAKQGRSTRIFWKNTRAGTANGINIILKKNKMETGAKIALALMLVGGTAGAVMLVKKYSAPKKIETKPAGTVFSQKFGSQTRQLKVEPSGHVTDVVTGQKVNIVGYKKAGQK